MPASWASDVMATVRAVATSSAPPIIGIQPWALLATRRRLSLELPPIQIGMGSWNEAQPHATASRYLDNNVLA
jgi:hypothetical protein